MIKKVFQALSFSEKETIVYTTLLGLGQAKAIDITKKTGLNRTTVYDTIDSLGQKGLVNRYKKGSKSFFSALEPKRLLNYLDREKEEHEKMIEQQKQTVKEFLPELISLQNPLSTKPKVQFFEGEKGVREAYEDTLAARDRILAYTNVEEMFRCLPNFFPEYFKRRTAAKIPIDAIFVDNPGSRERSAANREELRRTKFLPHKQDSFSPEIKIYNNKMMIASWTEKMAIIIESKELADLQKIVFKTLWDLLPENK